MAGGKLVVDPTTMQKLCTRCKESKHVSEYYKPRCPGNELAGYSSACKKCDRLKTMEWTSQNKDRVRARSKKYAGRYRIRTRARRVLSQYGITWERFMEMALAQRGVCAICIRPPQKKQLVVDHDHLTKVVRGLLCEKCNVAIGMFDDDSERMKSAAVYMEKYTDNAKRWRSVVEA